MRRVSSNFGLGRLLEIRIFDLDGDGTAKGIGLLNQAQTSSAWPRTSRSMADASVKSSAKVVSDPEDLRSRFARTGLSSSPREIA